MPPCICSFNPPSISISKFISTNLSSQYWKSIATQSKTPKKSKTGLARDTIAAGRALAFCATSSSARDLDYAYSVFQQTEKPNPFIWNTIIRGFCQSSDPHVANQLFVEMLLRSPTLPERLTCPSGGIVKSGLDSDPFIRNSIIHMYTNCGLLGNPKKYYSTKMRIWMLVAWNSMVMGLVKCGQVDESWRLSGKQ